MNKKRFYKATWVDRNDLPQKQIIVQSEISGLIGHLNREGGFKVIYLVPCDKPNALFLKPEILCHPHIPKPLHGVSPREIKGQNWWDETRQKAYKSTDYHCVACGVAKHEAKKHKWLEAHEFWNIDYNTGICEVKSIEPLCHYCHNFIHSGRLSMIAGKEKSKQEVIDILEHGFKVLAENNLKAFYFTVDFAKRISAKTFGVDKYIPIVNEKLKWTDFKLIFEGNEYLSKFKSQSEWQSFYNAPNSPTYAITKTTCD